MSQVCSRPGCAEPATATFLFAPAQLSAWLGDLDTDPRGHGNHLCNLHSSRISVPAGWTLEDTRTPRNDLNGIEPVSPLLARAFRSARAS